MAKYNPGYSADPEYDAGDIRMDIADKSLIPGISVKSKIYTHLAGQQIMCGKTMEEQIVYTQPGQYYLQPQPDIWMERPFVSEYHSGLENLTELDQLLVKQQIELFEVVSGYKNNTRYDVRNTFGQMLYKVTEDTDCCKRYWCGPNRPFLMHVNDSLNHEVIRIQRQFKCHIFGHCVSCASCCQDEIEVEAPPGVCVGFVRQCYEGCQVRYAIMNVKGDIVMKIHGQNYFRCYCPGDDYSLSLLSANGDIEVGRISKHWIIGEDNFRIHFPIDLDVRVKALILGAVFLIDFMFFERSRKKGYRF